MNYKDIFKSDLKNIFGIDVVVNYSDFSDYQSPVLLSNKSIDKDNVLSFLMSTNHYEKVDITGKGFISVKFKLTEI